MAVSLADYCIGLLCKSVLSINCSLKLLTPALDCLFFVSLKFNHCSKRYFLSISSIPFLLEKVAIVYILIFFSDSSLKEYGVRKGESFSDA